MKRLLVVVFAGLCLLAGCGGGTPAISVSASSSASTVAAGQTAQITATVSNDSANKGVSWTVSCSVASCGSVSPTSSTTSPFTTTYTAPSSAPSSNLTVTITATSVSDSTKSATVTITVPAISVSVNPSTPQTVEATQTDQFTATVGGTSNTGVTWTLYQGLTPCSPTCGTLSSSTTNPVTYTAPSTPPPSDLTVTLTAVSSADATKSASVTITVPAITVSVAPTAPTVTTSTTQNFTATVSNDPTTAGVTWSLAWNGSACTSASTCGSLSGPTTTTVTYNAPVGVPSPATVAVTATSLTDTSKTATAIITVTAAVNDSELKGQYGFLLQGFDDATGHQFAIVGSFVADGSGNVTSGLIDLNGPLPLSALSVTGTYSIGSDNRGTLTLNGTGFSRTFAIAVGSLNGSSIATKASMIEFDDTSGTTGNRGPGSIYLQDTTKFDLSAVNGPYASQLVGEDGTVGTRLVNLGTMTANGSGSVTNGSFDSDDSGTISNGTFTATLSTDSNTSAFGRMTMTLSGGATGTRDVYIIDATRILMMTAGNEVSTGLVSGELRAQSTSSFSDSSLNGVSVLYSVGLGSTAGDSDVNAGLLSFNGSGSVSISIDENNSGTISTNTGTYGYSVAANGRVTITGGSGHQPIFYLLGNNEGFEMSTDSGASAGSFEPQSAGPFTIASVSGNYFFGQVALSVTGAVVGSGVATSTGNGTLTTTGDVSGPGGVLVSGQSLSYTLTVSSNGRVTDNQGDIYYIISPSKVVAISSTSTTPDVDIVQH